ncbi:MAG: histidine kinase, partial [Acidobacteria bacterium]|nr:histidine kinase [Acidobacteriota bacterium]
MPTIFDLIKDHQTHFVEADQSVLDAARKMVEHSIGAVPVL